MRLIFTQFKEPKSGPKWPATYDQLGSRGHAFLVGSVSKELERIKKDFPDIKILHESISINRGWGNTSSALLTDADGVFFELVQIERPGNFFADGNPAPPPTEKAWLHFMMNAVNIKEQLAFYQSFGLYHDNRVDFRNEEIGFHPYGLEKFAKEHLEAMSMKFEDSVNCSFLWNGKDSSTMHLELLEYKPGRR